MPLRLVFFGSDAVALPALDWLKGGGSGTAQLVAVFTQPDRPAGRGQTVQPNAIKLWALDHGLPIYQPDKLTDASVAQLAAMQADLGLVMAYGHILRESFIATPRLGMLNLHASLLPKYRGASPIQTAVACGEHDSGVSLMRIVRRLDAGPVADTQRVPIETLDTAFEVEAKLSSACVPLLARTLPRLARGDLPFAEQADSEATYCRRLAKEDGDLDFAASAAVLAARINGLFPWPACRVELKGQPVKLGLADCVQRSETGSLAALPSAGTVLGADAEGLLVAAGDGVIRLRKLQRPGGRMLPAVEFLRGFPVSAGDKIPSRPMSLLAGSKPL